MRKESIKDKYIYEKEVYKGQVYIDKEVYKGQVYIKGKRLTTSIWKETHKGRVFEKKSLKYKKGHEKVK